MRKIKSIEINDAPCLSKWNELLKIIRSLLKLTSVTESYLSQIERNNK